MNPVFQSMARLISGVESRFPNVERRDSGPSWMDKTSDEYYEPELTDDQVEAQDSLFGLEVTELFCNEVPHVMGEKVVKPSGASTEGWALL